MTLEAENTEIVTDIIRELLTHARENRVSTAGPSNVRDVGEGELSCSSQMLSFNNPVQVLLILLIFWHLPTP